MPRNVARPVEPGTVKVIRVARVRSWCVALLALAIVASGCAWTPAPDGLPSSGSPSANLLTGGTDQTFLRTDGGGARYPITDALGSIIGLTDAAGSIATTYTYEPYGRTTRTGATSTNAQQYTGRENDGLALYYYRARYYNPTFGRFIAEDPAGFRSSDYNLYRYVGGSPTNATDPSGRVVDTAIDIGFIGYDLYALATGSRKDVGSNLAALGLDIIGAFIPFVTGLGALSRTARLADEVIAYGDEALVYIDDVAAAVCSFPADTEVATPDGSEEIGELKAGDTVLAWDEATGRVIERPIGAVSAHPDPVLTRLVIDGERLTTTPDHPFYVVGAGWVEAGQLHVGQHILSASGTSGVVGAVETGPAPARLWDLTVEGAHTYFVGEGEWLVHNCAAPRWGSTPAGRPYTRHYGTETGPVRNIPGSVVDHVIDAYPGVRVPGGKTVHYDPINDITVVTGDGGAIVSARPGPPRPGQLP